MTFSKLIFIIFYINAFLSNSQSTFYVASSNNDIVFVNIDNCSSQVLCNSGITMYDIALTPSNILYFTDGKKVFEINTTNCISSLITPIPVTDSNYSGGEWITSLVALDDTFLLAVSTSGILYKIDVSNGVSFVIGNVNYSSGGDLTWYKGKLLLATAGNQLVEIEVNDNCSEVVNVDLIGSMDTPFNSIYGVLTIGDANCTKDNLIVLAFENQDVYTVDPTDASLQLICANSFQFLANGAASITESNLQEFASDLKMPNVFSPNNDGVNDSFTPVSKKGIESFNISILNRWGETIFQSNDINFSWDGNSTSNNKKCYEGVYYYIVQYSDYCGVQYSFHNHLSLLR